MTEHTTPDQLMKRPGRWRRVLLYGLLGLIVLCVVALGLTQTQWFRDYLRDKIVELAGGSLNGTLGIQRLSGNLFNSVTAHGITLTQSRDTVATIAAVTIDYDLWALLDNTVLVEHLLIDRPQVNLVADEDGTWNVASLATTTSPAETETTGGTTSIDWTIVVAEFIVREGSAHITVADSLMPSRVDQLNLRAEARYSADKQFVTIHDLRFATADPAVQLREFRATVSLSDSTAVCDTLVMETEYNRVSASGRYVFQTVPSGRLTVIADSIDLRDVARFVTYELPPVRPSLRFEADLIRDSLNATMTISDQEQHVSIAAWADPLFQGIADTSGTLLSYDVHSDLELKRMQQWVSDTLASGAVAGSVRARGKGLDPGNANIETDLRLSRAAVIGYAVDSARLIASYAGDSADVNLSAHGRFGAVTLTGTLAAITEQLRYDIQLATRRLNLRRLMGLDAPETDLTMRVTARGEGYDPSQATGQASVALSKARIGDTQFDTLATTVRFNPNTITVDTFFVNGTPGWLAGSGTLGLDQRGSFRVEGEIGQTDWLATWLEVDTLQMRGHISAQVDGSLDSLAATATVSLADIRYDTYATDSVASQFSIVYSDSTFVGDYQLWLGNLIVADILIPTTTISGTIAPARYTADLSTRVNENISLSLMADYRLDSVPEVLLSAIRLQLGEQQWTTRDDTARVILRPESYELDGLRLTGVGLESPDAVTRQQTFAIDGVYGMDSTHNINLVARNIVLRPLMTLLDPAQSVDGDLSLDVTSSGYISNPDLRGTATIRSGRVREYEYDSLNSRFTLIDSLARADLTLHVQGPESLVVALTVPLAMLTDSTAAAPDSGLDLRVQSYGFTLAILRAFGYTVENAEGDLSIDFHSSRSIDNPRFDGQIRVSNGQVRAPSYGIDYRDIAADIRFDSSKAELTELIVRRGDGTLRATGRAEFAEGLVSGRLDAAHLSLTAKDFYVVRHSHYEAQISANANIGGPVTAPEYGGTITVRRSNVYLPALTEEISEGSSASVPLLVAALGDTGIVVDTTLAVPLASPDTATTLPSDYIQNLRGRLTVRFPRNTWLRDDDMNIEIEGQLDVVKDGPDFELFGTIDVVRGDYTLYGKKFRIDEGRLTFEGGATVNPRLAIDAIYTFRTPAREKRSLTLSIGGRAETPTLSFSLDGNPIEEGDAVSYIVFGRSIAELTSGQRSAISDEGDSKTQVAKGAIASLLAGQLTQTLGNEFSLDVIEINAQSDWQSASFVVGKYITNDLFVSYQRGLGTTRDDDDIVPEVVTLEYELSRHLFFQLVAADARKSGFDVIVKFDTDW